VSAPEVITCPLDQARECPEEARRQWIAILAFCVDPADVAQMVVYMDEWRTYRRRMEHGPGR
jgi:hypothetical protein